MQLNSVSLCKFVWFLFHLQNLSVCILNGKPEISVIYRWIDLNCWWTLLCKFHFKSRSSTICSYMHIQLDYNQLISLELRKTYWSFLEIHARFSVIVLISWLLWSVINEKLKKKEETELEWAIASTIMYNHQSWRYSWFDSIRSYFDWWLEIAEN